MAYVMDPPSWHELNAEHGRTGILRTRRQSRHLAQIEKRDAWYKTRHGCGYESYQIRKTNAANARLQKAERDISERVNYLKRSAAIKEMQRCGYEHILRAWHALAVGPGSIVYQRAASDFQHQSAEDSSAGMS